MVCCYKKEPCALSYTCPANHQEKLFFQSLYCDDYFCGGSSEHNPNTKLCCDPHPSCTEYLCPKGFFRKQQAGEVCLGTDCGVPGPDNPNNQACCDGLQCAAYVCPDKM